MDTIGALELQPGRGAKYLALADGLREAVSSGRLAAGAKLPPVRELAFRLGVTPGTVARAYQRLTEAGVLEAHVGRGTFVSGYSGAAPGKGGPDDEGPTDFRRSHAADVGQGRAIRNALIHAAEAEPGVLLDYPTRETGRALREGLVRYLAPLELGAFGPDDIALAHGAQHGLLLVLESVLTGAAPVVAMEELSFPGFRNGARLLRAGSVFVDSDADGPVPASLAAACETAGVQVFVTSAFAANPTTVRTSLARRREIAALARERNFQIVEDETYAQPDPGMPNYRALAPERSWYVGSLSKNLSPALRLGFVVAAEGRADEAVRAAQQTSFGVSIPIVTAAAELLRSGTAARVRDDIRQAATRRGKILAEALDGAELAWRPGVAFAWLRLPPGWRTGAFVSAAEAEGVLVRPAEEYVPLEGRVPNAVRISLNGRVPIEAYRAACGKLRVLLKAPPQEMAV